MIRSAGLVGVGTVDRRTGFRGALRLVGGGGGGGDAQFEPERERKPSSGVAVRADTDRGGEAARGKG